MATYKTKRGTTSLLIDIWIGDSSSTTGAGKTGLVYNSAGLVCKLQESDTASATTVSLASATEGTFTSGGFVESALGNGWYQLGIPNANIDSGTKTKGILYGATNMVPTPFVIELDAVDYQSATAFITGVNSLAPPTNWNLHSIDSNGRVDAIKLAGTTQTGRDIGASVLLSSGTGTGQVKLASGYVAIDWGDIANKTTTNALTGTTIATTQKVDVETIKTNPVVNAGTITFPTDATLASTTNITAGTITTTTNLTNAPPDSSGVTTLLSRIGGSITISGGRVEANVTYFGGAPGVFTVAGLPDVNTSHYGGVDVSLVNVPADVQTIKTQTVTCSAGVTVGPYVGNSTAAIAVDGSGYVTITNTIPTAGEIADSVWDEVQSGHTTAGTFGKYLDTEVSGVGGGGGPTAADIADAVWDEAQSGHTIVGTFGKYVDSQLSLISTDAASTYGIVNDGTKGVYAIFDNVPGLVWDELKADHTTPNTYGDYLDVEVSSVGGGGGLDAAGVRAAVGLASANLDTQLANTYNIVNSGTFGNQAIKTAVDSLAPASDVSSSFNQTYGSVISGTYTNTATDDNSRHVLAPHASNALDADYTFTIPTTNKPTRVTINGYFNGTAQYADVFAYNYETAAYVQLSNSTTRLNTRTSDTNYTFELSREYVEDGVGTVKIRFVSPSTNTAHRLHLDRILVYSLSEAGSEAGLTSQNVWEYATRTLTSASSSTLATGRFYYLQGDNNSDISGYKVASPTPSAGASNDLTTSLSGTSYTLIEEFATPSGEPSATELPIGVASRSIHCKLSHANAVAKLKVELYQRTDPGGTETLLRSSESHTFSGTTTQEVLWSTVFGTPFTLDSTDRIVFKIYGARVSGVSSFDLTTSYEGSDTASYIGTTLTIAGSYLTAAEVWDYLTADADTTGSMGKLIVDNVNAPLDTIDTNVDSILAACGTIDTVVDTIAVDTGNLTARLGAFTGTGVNTVLGFLKAVMRKDATLPSDIGGTYAVATDSLEGQVDNHGSGLTLNAERTAAFEALLDAVVRGEAVTDGGNSSRIFKTNLTTANSKEDYTGQVIFFDADASGDNAKLKRRIIDHDLSTGVITVDVAFDSIPETGDEFSITGYQSSVA